jgi:F420-non-reducing hydrogenase large subunit
VDHQGALNLYDGRIRLMKADGSFTDFDIEDYTDHIGEHVEDYPMASILMPAPGTKGSPWTWTTPRGFIVPTPWHAST